MCGIAGIMMRDGRQVDAGRLDRLGVALAHRGPDGRGRYVSGAVGLIQTRLAIVDLETGDQPFYEQCGGVLIANGEIYNDPELRDQLRDVDFTTRSDCEVPLHLYRRCGIRFVDHLRGMYALAIYDPVTGRLILSRDPFGIKPLYYVQTAECFAFASEPQALLAIGLASRSLRPQARAELLQLKFSTGAETIFSEIRRVLPGETLVIANGRITERFRRPALKDGPAPATNYDDALHRIQGVLDDTVSHHLRSDVPYGLFLSGGTDSSALAVLMSHLASEPLVAFTAVFPGTAAADERVCAERVARSVGADHHIIEITARDFWNMVPRIAAALDDPTTDPAVIPTYMLASAARNQLKVVLTGEGGDEIFCGYSRYYRARRLGGLLARKARLRGEFERLGPLDGVLHGWREHLNQVEQQQQHHGRTFIQVLQAVDCAEWLPNDLLIKVDRCLMAHGIEGRTPFLDPVVADFAFRLPDRIKATPRMAKRLLRDWVAVNVPAAKPYDRKIGFNPPVGEWLAARLPVLERLIASQPGIRAVFHREHVARAFADLKRSHQAAWSLLFYALWHTHHILGLPCDGTIEEVLGQAMPLG